MNDMRISAIFLVDSQHVFLEIITIQNESHVVLVVVFHKFQHAFACYGVSHSVQNVVTEILYKYVQGSKTAPGNLSIPTPVNFAVLY